MEQHGIIFIRAESYLSVWNLLNVNCLYSLPLFVSHPRRIMQFSFRPYLIISVPGKYVSLYVCSLSGLMFQIQL